MIDQPLAGQAVVVIGGSSGIGLETARLARANGAKVIITARNADRLYEAGMKLGASIASFDASDPARLEQFLRRLPGYVDHVMLAGRGPHYAPLADGLPVRLARLAAGAIRPGGTLLLVGDSAGLRGLAEPLAAELAPVRVHLIAPELPAAAARALHLMRVAANDSHAAAHRRHHARSP